MSAEPIPQSKPLLVDKQAVLRALAEHNAAIGFVPVPGATAHHARELMIADGIRPDNCEFSRDIIALREDGLRED